MSKPPTPLLTYQELDGYLALRNVKEHHLSTLLKARAHDIRNYNRKVESAGFDVRLLKACCMQTALMRLLYWDKEMNTSPYVLQGSRDGQNYEFNEKYGIGKMKFTYPVFQEFERIAEIPGIALLKRTGGEEKKTRFQSYFHREFRTQTLELVGRIRRWIAAVGDGFALLESTERVDSVLLDRFFRFYTRAERFDVQAVDPAFERLLDCWITFRNTEDPWFWDLMDRFLSQKTLPFVGLRHQVATAIEKLVVFRATYREEVKEEDPPEKKERALQLESETKAECDELIGRLLRGVPELRISESDLEVVHRLCGVCDAPHDRKLVESHVTNALENLVFLREEMKKNEKDYKTFGEEKKKEEWEKNYTDYTTRQDGLVGLIQRSFSDVGALEGRVTEAIDALVKFRAANKKQTEGYETTRNEQMERILRGCSKLDLAAVRRLCPKCGPEYYGRLTRKVLKHSGTFDHAHRRVLSLVEGFKTLESPVVTDNTVPLMQRLNSTMFHYFLSFREIHYPDDSPFEKSLFKLLDERKDGNESTDEEVIFASEILLGLFYSNSEPGPPRAWVRFFLQVARKLALTFERAQPSPHMALLRKVLELIQKEFPTRNETIALLLKIIPIVRPCSLTNKSKWHRPPNVGVGAVVLKHSLDGKHVDSLSEVLRAIQTQERSLNLDTYILEDRIAPWWSLLELAKSYGMRYAVHDLYTQANVYKRSVVADEADVEALDKYVSTFICKVRSTNYDVSDDE